MWSFVFTFLVFFVYGVLYYTVQLCRAAISMLFAYFIFFETSKVWKFYKENEERIIQFELWCYKTALFYLFLYICEWRQILLKKRGQRTLITVVLWFYFTFKAFLFGCFWFFRYWILAATVCTFAQFWGTFYEEKYRINLFVQDIWLANLQCNEFVETSYTSLFLKIPGVSKILTHQFFQCIWLKHRELGKMLNISKANFTVSSAIIWNTI